MPSTKSTVRDRMLQTVLIGRSGKMIVCGVSLREANAFIETWHRHHRPVPGHRFSLAAIKNGVVCGVSVVGRPVARRTCHETVVEVVRLATDGTNNACSKLYGASAREAKRRGFKSIQTFTLPREGGASLRAAGWDCVGETSGGSWGNRPNRVTDNQEKKMKWVRALQ